MNILTDEELWKFWWNKPEVADGEDDSMEAEFVAAARAIEAAVIKRLAAWVSVDPDGWRTQEYIGAPSQQEPYYNADTFTTAIAAARVQENERCAEELDGMKCNNKTATSAIKQCAEAIRALLGKEQS